MDFVYSVNDGLVAWGSVGSSFFMRPNDIWRADDPFVLARPELFSATPVIVQATDGRPTRLDPTPLEAARTRKAPARRG